MSGKNAPAVIKMAVGRGLRPRQRRWQMHPPTVSAHDKWAVYELVEVPELDESNPVISLEELRRRIGTEKAMPDVVREAVENGLVG